VQKLHASLAPFTGGLPPGYQKQMETLLDLVERRDEDGATRHLAKFLERVDRALLGQLEHVLETEQAPASAPRSRRRSSDKISPRAPQAKSARAAAASPKRKAGVR
jgi:hypothetical protein